MHLVRTVLSMLCVCAVAGAAESAELRLPRSTPEAQGISSSALLGFIDSAEEKLNALHSFMLVRHGKVVVEGWWNPYAAEEPHAMYSLSKSFTSTAVGLAIADGKLSVDDLVLKFFADEAPPTASANLRAMRVRDLLTMSTGHHDEDIRNFPFSSEESLVKKFLALPVAHKPGTFFVYNTPATYMLSAIVQKVTGQTVRDFLKPRLFEPLGIADPTWEASKQGVSLGGFGLSVRTEDIARFGQLYLQKGEWRGKQLVPAAWVDTATARHMSNGSSPASDWEQGYGYQFWRCRHGFYRGDGAHGQFCIVLPQYDAVVAITSGTRDMASVMNLVWEKIVPALQGTALPADLAAHDRLTAKLGNLALRMPTPAPTAAALTLAKTIAGKRYVFPANAQHIESIMFEAPRGATGTEEVTHTVRIDGKEQRIAVAPGAWRKTTLAISPAPEAVALSGAWTTDDTYTLVVSYYRTPFRTTFRMKFTGDEMTLEQEPNLGPAAARPPPVVGKAE